MIFSKAEVNTGRQVELDLLKAFTDSTIFMSFDNYGFSWMRLPDSLAVLVYNQYFKEKVEAICSKHRVVLTLFVWVITLGLAIWSFCSYTELPNAFNGYFMHLI